MNTIMKLFASMIIFIVPLVVSASCASEEIDLTPNNDSPSDNENSESMKDTVLITIGNNQFTAILESNTTATEFKKMLPLTINMKDLNSNEKFYDFPFNLPTNSSIPGTINTGDLMLWGSNTLVLFYRTFTTLYPYTRLGKIENTNGLSQALGTGNVKITFEVLSK